MQIRFISPSTRPASLLGKLVFIVSALLLGTLVLMFSAVLLVALLVAALAGGIYVWWKLRKVRKLMAQMQQQFSAQGFAGSGFAQRNAPQDANVFEGEVVHVDEARVRIRN